MSYEHCDTHDADATNGCAECIRELVGEWLIEHEGATGQYNLTRNGSHVASLPTKRLALVTLALWVEHLTHSGAEWEDYT